MLNNSLPTQNPRNSCAAHCLAISLAELGQGLRSLDDVHDKIWPAIQFDGADGTADLQAAENSDPRKIVALARQLAPRLTTEILADDAVEASALLRLPSPKQAPMHLLFGLLTLGERHVNNFAIDAGVFYNCSYLAFSAGVFTGMHNILVTRDGPHVWYYNSNEDWPRWAVANDWRALTGRNGGTADYFFTGVCVTMRA